MNKLVARFLVAIALVLAASVPALADGVYTPSGTSLSFVGARLLHWGDSFPVQAVGSTGGAELFKSPASIATIMEGLSLGQFAYPVQNMKGVFGQTCPQVQARFATDVAPFASNFDVAIIDCGRNDTAAAKSDGDATLASIEAMVGLVQALGKQAYIALPNPPRSAAPNSATNQQVRGYVNQQIRYWAAAHNVPVLDYWRDTVDATVSTGAWASGNSSDNLHMNGTGALIAGQRSLAQVSGLAAGATYNQPAWDIYNSSTNPFGNQLSIVGAGVPLLEGSSVVSGTGLTGFGPSGWTIAVSQGAATTVASKVTGVSGFGSIGSDAECFAISAVTSSPYTIQMTTGFTQPASLGGATAAFTGAISGGILTVSAVSSGTITAGTQVDGNSTGISPFTPAVVAGTFITGQLSGSAGSTGTYSVSIPQTATSQSMVSGLPLEGEFQIYHSTAITGTAASFSIQAPGPGTGEFLNGVLPTATNQAILARTASGTSQATGNFAQLSIFINASTTTAGTVCVSSPRLYTPAFGQ